MGPRCWPPYDPDLAIHEANIVLGQVAFRTGDFEASQRYLLAAADVSGRNGVLVTYGPDLDLAQQLLEQGFRETVVEYLSAWRRRWKIGRDLLDWWIKQIIEGRPARVNRWKYLETRRLRHFFPILEEILRTVTYRR